MTDQPQHQPSDLRTEREVKRHPPDAEAIARGHEADDVGIGAYIKFAVWFVVATTIICGITYWMMAAMARSDAKSDPPRSMLAEREKKNLVPQGPLLQPSPPQGEPRQAWQDTRAFHEKEQRVLDSYAVVDARAGVVQIPIVRAMNILAERGLPTAAGAQGGATTRPSLPATQPAQRPAGGFR